MSTYPASFPEHSPRNANYTIDVELDPSTKTMTGREVVTWRNITSKPTSELQFHTYWNAWRNTRSTFMREWLRVNGGAPDAADVLSRPPSDWSSLDVTADSPALRRRRGDDRSHAGRALCRARRRQCGRSDGRWR